MNFCLVVTLRLLASERSVSSNHNLEGQVSSAPDRDQTASDLFQAEESDNEDLRAQINSLKYELDNLHQERNLLSLQHEKELRDVQQRADADYSKYQVCK